MALKVDIKGQRFGRLTVIEEAGRSGTKRCTRVMWKCLCDCKNITIVSGTDLRTGNTTSCGCYFLESRTGEGNPMRRTEIAAKMSVIQKERLKIPENYAKICGENSNNWHGGISFEPYCPLFNEDLKERVRIWFDRRCVICGKTQEENGAKLSIHHVEYDKLACCHHKPVHFATACRKCHGKTNRDRPRWEAMLHTVIDEIYDGRSYYTKEEFKQLMEEI